MKPKSNAEHLAVLVATYIEMTSQRMEQEDPSFHVDSFLAGWDAAMVWFKGTAEHGTTIEVYDVLQVLEARAKAETEEKEIDIEVGEVAFA